MLILINPSPSNVKDIVKPIDEKEFKMKIPFHKYYRPNVYLLGHQKRETEFLGSCSLLSSDESELSWLEP